MLLNVRCLRIPHAIQRTSKLYRTSTNTNTVTDELKHIEPQSIHHQDLPSFLEYASRIGLNPKSTVYVGNHYEYTVLSALGKLGMSLKRTGGASDFGIDLLGTWSLPAFAESLKVIVQCKTMYGGPVQARELEGAFVGAPSGWSGPGVLGFLVSQKKATKAHRRAIYRSSWPMGYIYCKKTGEIMQMSWNKRARQEGLDGVSVEVRYTGGDMSKKEVILTWKGHVLTK